MNEKEFRKLVDNLEPHVREAFKHNIGHVTEAINHCVEICNSAYILMAQRHEDLNLNPIMGTIILRELCKKNYVMLRAQDEPPPGFTKEQNDEYQRLMEKTLIEYVGTFKFQERTL